LGFSLIWFSLRISVRKMDPEAASHLPLVLLEYRYIL